MRHAAADPVALFSGHYAHRKSPALSLLDVLQEFHPGDSLDGYDSPITRLRVPNHYLLRVVVSHFHTAVGPCVGAGTPVRTLAHGGCLLIGRHLVEVVDRSEDEVSNSGSVDRRLLQEFERFGV